MWDWHIAEGWVDYSPRWFTMLGYAPDEYPGTYDTFADLLHPEDKRRVEATVMKAVEGQTDGFQMDFRRGFGRVGRD
ncbi:MAG: PAS domain-containing protein, partial [Woeseiaceae bacterium]